MLSTLELRHVIETAFLPGECECEISDDGIVSITLLNNADHQSDYFISGIHVSELATSRSIASLVMVLKEEARLSRILAEYRRKRAP
ncbi:DUF1652 domain-containing protein (plasmid) [Pseudomonas sp. App30]|uniref:DUF1652 domain-containing protein n=1 Tax=Pseudomonas sp. App30 TaxID=3068990 RepID=UPI003A800A62